MNFRAIRWLAFVLFMPFSLSSQIPQAFKYQAVARNPLNQPYANTSLQTRITLKDALASGMVYYQEKHVVLTSALGIFNLNIGEGTPITGDFEDIPWASGSISMKVEMSIDGGTNWLPMGESALLAVPYALYAASAPPDADADPANEIQSLTWNSASHELGITGGNSVSLPATEVSAIKDSDGDTRITVEENPDEDILKGYLANNLRFTVYPDRFELIQSGNTKIGQRSVGYVFTPATGSTGNSSIGLNALYALSTGDFNNAIGASSLYYTNTGSYNNGMGYLSLYQNTNGQLNTGIGFKALYGNNTGSSNIAIGSHALYSNISGSNLLAIGDSALYNNTIQGTGNIAIGPKALLSNLSGDNNSAVGYEAIKMNNSGSDNTASGYKALSSNSTGSYNLAIGSQAAAANISGSYIAAGGYFSLSSNTTGSNNTGFGALSLRYNTTGSHNTAFGRGALYTNTAGTQNVAMGMGSLYYNDSGNYNTAAGYFSLLANSSGNNNTSIGYEAGRNNVAGSGNVFLGAGAGYNEAGNNKLYIENSQSADPLIYGDFDQNVLRVNGRLEITGNINVHDSGNQSPAAGTIRWNETTQDFEGFTGVCWKSLTQKGGNWGVAQYTSSENYKLTTPEGAADDYFGYSVAICGNYAAIGAPYHGSGKVYIYQRDPVGWKLLHALTPIGNETGFGNCVALSSEYLMVGIGPNGNNLIRVYQFNGTSWQYNSALLPSDGYGGFGLDISISGSYAVVGSWTNAYIFELENAVWIQQAILPAPGGTAPYSNYIPVSISGDYAIVGAPGYDFPGNSNQGRAYIYHKSGTTWTLQSTLSAPDGSSDDSFGHSVAIYSDNSRAFAVVGAPQFDVGSESNQGQAYVFTLVGTSWGLQSLLQFSNGNIGDWFGEEVAIQGEEILISCRGLNKAFVFQTSKPDWIQNEQVTLSPNAENLYEHKIALSGNCIIIGSPYDAVNGNDNQGNIFIFQK